MNTNAILLGQGSLSWPRMERVSDRYGYISLYDSNSQEEKIANGAYLNVEKIKALSPKIGQLVVQIIETRQSTHIGDLFRGFAPVKPEENEEILLGKGKLSYLVQDGIDTVGLIPSDERRIDWLDPKMLYRSHEQTVMLYFIPD